MEQLTGDAITVASAGSHLKPLHPNAVRVMREHGIDISTRQSRHLNTLAGQRFDHLITLCDRLREICPEFPGPAKGLAEALAKGPAKGLAEAIHWSIPDPATAGGSGSGRRQRGKHLIALAGGPLPH